MRIVGIGGEPASGKTTVVQSILDSLEDSPEYCKGNLLRYQRYTQKRLIVLGVYQNGQIYGGTDRLSMAVQPETIRMIDCWSAVKAFQDWNILFEGDRLFNYSFLKSMEALNTVDRKWFLLKASEAEKQLRHTKRGDAQNEVWLKGRITKLENLQSQISDIVCLDNNTTEDIRKNAKTISEALNLV